MCLTLFHFNRLTLLGDSPATHHADAARIRTSATTAFHELTAYVCTYIGSAGAGSHVVCYCIVEYMGGDNMLAMLKQHVSSGQMTDRLNYLGHCTLPPISNTYTPLVRGVI